MQGGSSSTSNSEINASANIAGATQHITFNKSLRHDVVVLRSPIMDPSLMKVDFGDASTGLYVLQGASHSLQDNYVKFITSMSLSDGLLKSSSIESSSFPISFCPRASCSSIQSLLDRMSGWKDRLRLAIVEGLVHLHERGLSFELEEILPFTGVTLRIRKNKEKRTEIKSASEDQLRLAVAKGQTHPHERRLSVEKTLDRLAASNMFFIAMCKHANQEVLYLSAKIPRGIPFLIELTIVIGTPGVKCTMKTPSPEMAPLFFEVVETLLKS
ncbi:hypothetical protein BC332_22293 [Capsicum chinense]|nr:hypothetical protein BC332_22293 [Capsicum chinense]